MTVSQLKELLENLPCNDIDKEVKIVNDPDSGSYLCTDEGNGRVKIIVAF